MSDRALPADLDWSQLQAFHAAVRCGSLTRAAELLKVSQPTLGRRVTLLERKLGRLLVVRGPGGIVLTAAGEVLAEATAAMATALDALGGFGAAPAWPAQVRLGVYKHVAAPTLLAQLDARWPDLTTGMRTVSLDGARALARSDLDLLLDLEYPSGAAGGRPSPGGAVRSACVAHVPLELAVGGPLADRVPVPARLSDLGSLSWVSDEDDAVYAAQRAVWESAGLDAHVLLRSSNIVSVYETIQAGRAAGLFLGGARSQGRIRLVPFEDPPVCRLLLRWRTGLGWPPGAPYELWQAVRAWYLELVADSPSLAAWLDSNPRSVPSYAVLGPSGDPVRD